MGAAIVVWLLLSAGVGALAIARGRGFFGFFLLSLLLSPLVGLVVLLVMRDEKLAADQEWRRKRDDEQRLAELRALAAGAAAPAGRAHELDAQPPASIADELNKLVALRDKGVITEAEFQGQKARLLSSPR